MTCPKELELSLFAGGDVRELQARRITQHLHSCQACAQAVHEFRVVRSAVMESRAPMPPHLRSALPTQVLSRIAVEQGNSDQVSLWHRLRWGIAGVATACVSIAILGLQPDWQALELPQVALAPARPPAQGFALSEPFRLGSSPAQPAAARPETAADPLDAVKLSSIADADGEGSGVRVRIPSDNPAIEIHWLID
ncbi:MAG: hypothetical protein F4X12_03980 [Acidobacteriia bacterium]|nr:hypothetical protein [Terriglobia bacterium]